MKKLYFVRTLILAGSLLLQVSTLCFHSHAAAAGDVDLSFDPGFGVNGPVNAVVVQPDGKVLIGGQFTMVKGLARVNVARLNADGSGDTTFGSGNLAHDVVSALALQSDGKVLMGSGGIFRLNSDGSQDTNFNASIAPYYSGYAVASIAVQPDGKVLIGGAFGTVNGTNQYGIARLNANGSLDGSFDPGTGANGRVASVALQPDGKVLIGGGFNTVNGTNRYGIARLNDNGSLDSSFNPNPGLGGYIYGVISIVVQSDGKVLIGGDFGSVNGTNHAGIARLNANGSLDNSFNPGTGVGWYPLGVWSIVVQSDGKVLIGGNFYSVNGTNRNNVARLNADGSLDSSFNPGTDTRDFYLYGVSSVVVQSDGKVLMGGGRSSPSTARTAAELRGSMPMAVSTAVFSRV